MSEAAGSDFTITDAPSVASQVGGGGGGAGGNELKNQLLKQRGTTRAAAPMDKVCAACPQPAKNKNKWCEGHNRCAENIRREAEKGSSRSQPTQEHTMYPPGRTRGTVLMAGGDGPDLAGETTTFRNRRLDGNIADHILFAMQFSGSEVAELCNNLSFSTPCSSDAHRDNPNLDKSILGLSLNRDI